MAGLVFCKSSLFLPVCPHARPVGAVCSLVRLFLRSAWASAVAFSWFSLAVPSGCRLGVSRLPALTGRGRFRFTCSSFRFRLPRSGVTRTAFWSPGVVACACAGLRLILEPPFGSFAAVRSGFFTRSQGSVANLCPAIPFGAFARCGASLLRSLPLSPAPAPPCGSAPALRFHRLLRVRPARFSENLYRPLPLIASLLPRLLFALCPFLLSLY